MELPSPTRPAGPGIRDLMGFMVGFAVAASLFRQVRPGDSAGLAAWSGFLLAFTWIGLAASGPFVAWLFRIGDPGELPDRTPKRPGQWIGSVTVVSEAGRRVSDRSRPRTRKSHLTPERLWIQLGSFCIFFGIVGKGSIDPTSLATYLAVQTTWFCIVLDVILFFLNSPPDPTWTDRLARVILLTWPLAAGGFWILGHG